MRRTGLDLLRLVLHQGKMRPVASLRKEVGLSSGPPEVQLFRQPAEGFPISYTDSHMLSQQFRFHGHGSLRYLYRNGLTVRNRNILLKYCENKQRTHSRVAVVVGKKVVKSAVKRNQMRRRIFEVVRRHWDHIPEHYDFSLTVFTAEFLTMTPEEVEQNVIGLLKQARLYKTSPKTTTPLS